MRISGDWGGAWTYEVADRLGSGGLGIVYRGSSEQGEPVAIKVILLRRPGGQELPTELAQREIEIATKLRDSPSDHLIRIHDVGHDDDYIYVVMDLAETALADRLPELGDTPSVISVLKHVAQGLVDLHQLGIIHRDLKPSNVLLHEGHWKLADFGIARDESIGTQTLTFVGWGTPDYMAPELFDNRSPTIKSDLYAYGCLAFELITGSRPFPGPDLESFRKQHLSDPPPLLQDDVPSGLRSLLLRLLSKDLEDRPPDARAVYDRLDRLQVSPGGMADRMQRLAAEHAQERTEISAQEAAVREKERGIESLVRQSGGDLHDLCEETIEQLARIFPEARLEARGDDWVFRSEDAELAVVVWPPPVISGVEGDSMVAGGAIWALNRRVRDQASMLANLIYEFDDEAEGYRWILYRFNAASYRYEYGPSDRPHGMQQEVFRDRIERSYMLTNVTHVWTIAMRAKADPSYLVYLFSEALALPGLPTP